MKLSEANKKNIDRSNRKNNKDNTQKFRQISFAKTMAKQPKESKKLNLGKLDSQVNQKKPKAPIMLA